MLKREYRNIFENQDKHWWYLGNGEIKKSLLRKFLEKKKDIKILDVGCGTGSAFNFLSPFGEITGIDISDEALKFAKKKKINIKKGNITDLPFPNSSFDLVVCFDVLYHAYVKDCKKAIMEMNRVLKKDGILLLREPAFEWLKSSHDVVDFTARRFTKKTLGKLLKPESFKILKLTYVNFFLFPLVFMKRLPEIIFLKKKETKSDIFPMPSLINSLLARVMFLESLLVNNINFPWGTSVICIAKKK